MFSVLSVCETVYEGKGILRWVKLFGNHAGALLCTAGDYLSVSLGHLGGVYYDVPAGTAEHQTEGVFGDLHVSVPLGGVRCDIGIAGHYVCAVH